MILFMETIPFIDPHVHADNRSSEEFPRLKTAGCKGIVIVAGAGGGYRSPDSLLDHFRRLSQVDRRRVERAHLSVWLALGAHPSGIPEKNVDTFLEFFPQALKEYGASVVGEIGLEHCTSEEERVLAYELQVAASYNMPVIIHTPQKNKAQAIERTLDILLESPLASEYVLLDHLNRDVLPQVLSSRCWLGLSVHPAKLSPDDAAAIVAEHGPDRFVLSSDTGAHPSYLFAFPSTISAMEEKGVEKNVIYKVVYEHALSWLFHSSEKIILENKGNRHSCA
jgi:hypothetical protein